MEFSKELLTLGEQAEAALAPQFAAIANAIARRKGHV